MKSGTVFVRKANIVSHEVDPRGALPLRQTRAACALEPISDFLPFCPILAHPDANVWPSGARTTPCRWPVAMGIPSWVTRTTSPCLARPAAAPRGLASASRRHLDQRRKKERKRREQRVARGGLWYAVRGAPRLSGGAAATMGAVASCVLVEGSGGSPLDLALALAALNKSRSRSKNHLYQ